jgi:DNA-binding NtrC family response regulator
MEAVGVRLMSMDPKILFVDDDSNVLDAYKRQLRKQFLVETALGAEEGLNAIASQGPFAVVVSDLRMPGMDGNQFLARVRDIAPKSVRMMLTGYADFKTALEAINSGSVFKLLTKPCDKEILSEALNTALEQYRKNNASRQTHAEAAARPKKKVLLVDDDRVILKIITDALTQYSELSVMTAMHGGDAISLMDKEDVDIVVTDLYMPVLNGLQLLSYMNKNRPGTPVIVLTGHGSKEIEARVKALGEFQYFEKPLDVNVLAETLVKTLYSAPSGQIHGISITSFLQLIDIEERICTLKIRSEKKFGRLYFMRGELVAAETGQLNGEKAAMEIISWDNSVIEIENVCTKNKKEINKPLMHILMESARLKDEISAERN